MSFRKSATNYSQKIDTANEKKLIEKLVKNPNLYDEILTKYYHFNGRLKRKDVEDTHKVLSLLRPFKTRPDFVEWYHSKIKPKAPQNDDDDDDELEIPDYEDMTQLRPLELPPQNPVLDNPQQQLAQQNVEAPQNIPPQQPQVLDNPQKQLAQNPIFNNIEMNNRGKLAEQKLLWQQKYTDKPGKAARRSAKADKLYTKYVNMPKEELAEKMAIIESANDSRAFYGEKQPFAAKDQKGNWPMSQFDNNYWNTVKQTKGNEWISAFNKGKDFSYNPKMLDPQYASWKAHERGNYIYDHDINNDGIKDLIEIDPDDDMIRTFNGYSVGPSKQQLYREFYDVDANKAVANFAGKPVYPVAFNDWYNTKTSQMSKQQLEAANKGRGEKGMAGYKLKKKTITENVKDYIKGAKYNSLCERFANHYNIPINAVKKSIPLNSLSGYIVRLVLFALTNSNTTQAVEGMTAEEHRAADNKILSTITSCLNSKDNRETLSPQIEQIIKQFCDNVEYSGTILADIWNYFVVNKSVNSYLNFMTNVLPKIKRVMPVNQNLLQALQTSAQKKEVRRQEIAAGRANKQNVWN